MMRTMKNRIVLYRWMIVAWLLLGWLPVSAQTESVFGKSSMTNGQNQISDFQTQIATAPSYQFRSTSPYTGLVNSTSTVGAPSSAPSSGIRRGPWDPPEDNPIGVLPDPAPMGEPFVLLALAALYCLVRCLRKRKTA